MQSRALSGRGGKSGFVNKSDAARSSIQPAAGATSACSAATLNVNIGRVYADRHWQEQQRASKEPWRYDRLWQQRIKYLSGDSAAMTQPVPTTLKIPYETTMPAASAVSRSVGSGKIGASAPRLAPAAVPTAAAAEKKAPQEAHPERAAGMESSPSLLVQQMASARAEAAAEPATVPEAHLTPSPALSRLNRDLVVRRGTGVWVETVEGRRLLDMTSGIGALSTGHSHPDVVKAVQYQVGEIVHAQQNIFAGNMVHGGLFTRLCGPIDHLPTASTGQTRPVFPTGHDTFFWTNSGSEALENAIKLAKHAHRVKGAEALALASTGGAPGVPVYQPKAKSAVISFRGGFHGRTIGTMSMSSSKATYRAGLLASSAMPGTFFCPFFTQDALETIFAHQVGPEEICAIFLEPVQGEGGVVPVPLEFLRYLRQVCDEHGIMLIYDEVQSGAGRCGEWWGYQSLRAAGEDASDPTSPDTRYFDEEGHPNADISPDIICFAKGIASGFPVGGISAPKRYWMESPSNSFGGTAGGNPLGGAAVKATVDVVERERLIENAREMGAYLGDEIRKLPVIRDMGASAVRQQGLFIAVDLPQGVEGTQTGLSAGRSCAVPRMLPDAKQCAEVCDVCKSVVKGGKPGAKASRRDAAINIPVSEVMRRLRDDEDILVQSCAANSMRIIPALMVSKNECDYFLAAMERVFTQIDAEVRGPSSTGGTLRKGQGTASY